MKRSSRLDKIAVINQGFEHIAGAALSNAQAQQQQQVDQLKQLEIYKEEYQVQLKSRLETPISAKEIQDYQYLFASLDAAIEQQVEAIKKFAVEVEATKDNWIEKKQEVKKVSLAADNIRQQEDHLKAKQEQQQTDEFNQQFFNSDQGSTDHH